MAGDEYAVTMEHSHEWDKETSNPAEFFGTHTHGFNEGDDHYHELSSGRDPGISPHDLHQKGDRCSPCGYGIGGRA